MLSEKGNSMTIYSYFDNEFEQDKIATLSFESELTKTEPFIVPPDLLSLLFNSALVNIPSLAYLLA